jgi:hypothetical protein
MKKFNRIVSRLLHRAYKFAPLQHPDSIRLLTLHAGERSSTIKISLREVRSSEKYEYEALSYTWATDDGDDCRSCLVQCGSKYIKVTKNCEAALQRLRYPEKERVLWVDAICIDQDNLEERGHQVGLMRNIYSKANGVLIWLGDASKRMDRKTNLPVSDLYLSHVNRMAEEMQALRSDQKPVSSSALYQQLLSDTRKWLSDGKETALLRGLQDVHCRQWWERIWVVQEARLAKSARLICSEKTARYSAVRLWYEVLRKDHSTQAIEAENELRRRMGASLNHLSLVRLATVKNRNDNLSLMICRLLDRARYLEASNPRDHVFGILGVSVDFSAVLPDPDYSITPSEVFAKVAKALLSHEPSLQILTMTHATRMGLDHPSWAPDWSVFPVSGFPDDSYNCYRAGADSKAIYEISSDGKELRVLGKEVDRVTRISRTDEKFYYRSAKGWKGITGWKESCGLGFSLNDYSTGEAVEEAVWRTLCWNVDKDHEYPAPRENGVLFKEWYRILTSSLDPEDAAQKMEDEQNQFAELIRTRRSPLCITAKNFLASVPYPTEVGDCIVVLSGGNVPFVLRPVKDHYRLIGPCYVHGNGIMDGEAFPKDESELQWFSVW